MKGMYDLVDNYVIQTTGMEFIDINCMIGEWIYRPLRFKEPGQLMVEMQRLGISRSMVFHSRSWLCDINIGNDSMTGIAEEFPDRIIPSIVLTPLIKQEFGGRQQLIDFLKKHRIGAVRLFPSDHNYSLDLWNMESLFSILEEVGMPVLIEGRELTGSLTNYFSRIYELGIRYKNVNIVLLAIGYRSLRTICDLMDKCPNVHIDTSTFITYRGIEDAVRNVGAERIFFGSRMPFMEGGVSVGRLIYADIDNVAKEKIAGGNLRRILEKNTCFNPSAKILYQ